MSLDNTDLSGTEQAVLDHVTCLTAIQHSTRFFARNRCLEERFMVLGVKCLANGVERLNAMSAEHVKHTFACKANTTTKINTSLFVGSVRCV